MYMCISNNCQNLFLLCKNSPVLTHDRRKKQESKVKKCGILIFGIDIFRQSS